MRSRCKTCGGMNCYSDGTCNYSWLGIERSKNEKKEKIMGDEKNEKVKGKKPSADAPRGNIYYFRPGQLTLVRDPTHYLYDIRATQKADPAMVASIRSEGVIEPIICVKSGEDILVVAGRRRVIAALIVAEDGSDLRIPVIFRKGDEGQQSLASATENGVRLDESPIQQARKAADMLNRGIDPARVAIAFGTNKRGLDDLTALLDLAPEVRLSVEVGTLSVSAAQVLAKLEPAAQVKQLTELEAASKAAEAAGVGNGKRKKTPTVADVRKQVRGERTAPTKNSVKLLASRLGCEQTTKSAGSHAALLKAALDWVTGERKTLPFKDYGIELDEIK